MHYASERIGLKWNLYLFLIFLDCVVGEYRVMEDTQYFGADPSVNSDTDEKCRAACDASSTCFAYGFDTKSQVAAARRWVHHMANIIHKILWNKDKIFIPIFAV